MLRLSYFKTIVFVVAIIFTFLLRAHNYERFPSPNHLDEQLYALSGIYLVETGVPVSWSTLDYPKSAEVYKGTISYQGGEPSASVTLYKPWLDEPPLFSLLVGETAHLFHADRNGFIPSSYIRLPVVIISTLTSILVFLIAKEVSGFWIGILAMLIYGTEPIIVFGSRIAMPENLIAFFFSLLIFLLLKFQKAPKFKYLIPIPFLAGMAGLAKPTGYFILFLAVYLVFIELYRRKFDWSKIVKYLAYLIFTLLPFVGFYVWYGNHFSPEIFKRILSIQGFRPVGFGNLSWLFMTPSFGTTVFRSGWYVFCLLSAVFFIFKPKKKSAKILSWGFVYWAIIIILSSGEYDLLAWYRFPLFPLLAIFGAWGIEYIFKKADFFASFLAVGFFLSSRSLLVNPFRSNISQGAFRAVFSFLLVPSLAAVVFKQKWLKTLSQVVIIGVIIIGIWWNIKFIYNAFEITCESQTCPLVPGTFLSRLYFPVVWRFLVL